MRTTPTKKQRDTFKEVLKGESISASMRKAGYSKVTSSKPKNVTETQGWKALVEEQLPDKMLLRVHKEGLKAGDELIINNKRTGIKVPDYAVRHKYLDTAYKIKNKIPKEGVGVAVQVNFGNEKNEYA